MTTDKTELSQALAIAASVCGNSHSLPILANVAIRSDGKSLNLTATDLDVEVTMAVKCGGEPFTITLPAKRVASVIANMPTETIDIDVDGESATIKSGSAKTKLLGLPVDDFPSSSDQEPTARFDIAATELQSVIRRCLFSVSNDESRYVLNGIYLTCDGAETLAIATDGRRMSVVNVNVDCPTPFAAIIPTKAFGPVSKIIGSAGQVQVGIGEGFAQFSTSKGAVKTKLIEGNFPNWQQVLPAKIDAAITVDREAFYAASKRATLMVDLKTMGMRLDLADGQITVSSKTPDAGEASEIVDAQCSQDFATTVNAGYLVQCLGALSSDTVQIEATDADTPLTIVDEGFRHVLMPMRTA
jgi:DNA polymerase-3 subunit beta